MTHRKPLEIVLLGDPGSGKTNLLSRFTSNQFNPKYEPTNGINFDSHTLLVGDQKLEMDLLDLPGHKKWRRLADRHLCDADGILLVYDISNPTTFENLGAWLRLIHQTAPPKTVIMLTGNKCDLPDRAVSIKKAEQFATDNDLSYIETSALKNSHVHVAFESIAQEIDVATQSVSEPSTDSFVQKNLKEASSGHDGDQHDKPFQVVLIDIEQAARKNIVCIEKPLDEANLEFIAISYRWGEVGEQVVDTELGYMTSVTSFALEDFYRLCQDMMEESDLQSIKYVWVDAICVDQNNPVRRKATIYQMSNIYHRAAYILAVPDLHLEYLKRSGLSDNELWRNEYDLDELIYYLLHEKADKIEQVVEKSFDEMGIPRAEMVREQLISCDHRFSEDPQVCNLEYTDYSGHNSCYNSSTQNDHNTPITLLDRLQRSINECHDHSENTTLVYENSDCVLCSYQIDMRKYQSEALNKNEVCPDQIWLLCVLRELQYDTHKRLVENQMQAIIKFMDYLKYLIKDWSSRVWVISEYNIAKTKQSRKMKFWFLSLDTTWKDSEKLEFFVFDFDKTEPNYAFSGSDIQWNYITRQVGYQLYSFQSTFISQLNTKSFLTMMLDSKASRNEDRFYAILPSTEYKNMLANREEVSSWQIDNIVSVKLKLYELMTTKHKLELLYLTSRNQDLPVCTFPAFAHRNMDMELVDTVKEENNDGRPCNFKLNNSTTLRLVPPDVSLENEIGSHFYKLRLSPNMYYVIHNETAEVKKLFGKILNETKKLWRTLEINYDDDGLVFVSIPMYMYEFCKGIPHITLFGSFKESKWLICDDIDKYCESYSDSSKYFAGFFIWKCYDNSDGNTSFDIY